MAVQVMRRETEAFHPLWEISSSWYLGASDRETGEGGSSYYHGPTSPDVGYHMTLTARAMISFGIFLGQHQPLVLSQGMAWPRAAFPWHYQAQWWSSHPVSVFCTRSGRLEHVTIPGSEGVMPQ